MKDCTFDAYTAKVTQKKVFVKLKYYKYCKISQT